jgi:Bifunctional DNA primase/polymerase, N-terminal
VDDHGPAGNGYPAFARLTKAGLLDGAAAYIRTPSGGLHAYFTGSDQRNGHLPDWHLDFRSTGGYVLAPPSWAGGKPYHLIRAPGADGALDWAAATALLEPHRQSHRPPPRPAPGRDLSHLARWVAGQHEGNRNAGLFWAANRALDADPAADLSPLAIAARHAGLDEREITRTLDSARKTGQPRPPAPDYQAEAGDPS